LLEPPDSPPVLYQHGTCIWTDADCDVCTGLNGNETAERWGNMELLPPSPRIRIRAGDRSVRIEWDNSPEVLASAGVIGEPGARFIGYHVYKLADWRESQSQVAPPGGWSLFQAYYFDTTSGGSALAAITDTTIDYERILYEQKLYPTGRYAAVDREVLDGFDYAYSVSSVIECLDPFTAFNAEPLVGSFQNVVRPRGGNARRVWVVPGPGNAEDRPNVVGGRSPSTSWACHSHARRSGSGRLPGIFASSAQKAKAHRDLSLHRRLLARTPDWPLRGDPMSRAARIARAFALAALATLASCGREHDTTTAPAPPPPPEIEAFFPPPRSRSIFTDTQIWAQFHEPLDPATVNTHTVFLKHDTQRLACTATYEAATRRIRVTPTAELTLRKTYTIELTPAIRR
jgi:hypothetical protein